MNEQYESDRNTGSPPADNRSTRSSLYDTVAGLQVIIWELKPGRGFTFVSDYAETLLGYPLERWLNEPEFWADTLLHPDDREWAVNLCEDATRAGRDHDFVYRAVAADGRVYMLRDIVRVDRDQEGNVLRLRGAMTDVTAQMIAEQALRENEERFRQLATSLNEIFWFMSVPDMRVLYVSPAFEKIWGRPATDVYGGLGIASESVHPDDRALLDGSIAAAAQGEEGVVEYRLQQADQVRWLRTRVAPARNLAGIVVRVVGVTEDITSAKEAELEQQRATRALAASEARFRGLTEHAADLISILTADGTVLYESPAVQRVLGFAPSERVGRSGFDFVHPGDHERARAALRSAASKPGTPRTIVLRTSDSKGEWRTAELTATNLLADEAIGGIVLNWRDITDRLQLEEQYRQAQKLDAIGRLAGGIAHDFNNLLTAIRGHADLMLHQISSVHPLREDAEQIMRATDRAAELTSQLLAFGRRQVLRPTIVNANVVVEDMKRLLHRLTGAAFTLRTELDPEIGLVSVDGAKLEQVVMNLVVNARDAMPAGGTITIRTCVMRGILLPGATQDVCTVLSVTDAGVGMNDETLARVFEPFYTTKEPGKGTGLGLSTVYGIVQQSGGYVWAESKPGQGSTFHVALPVAEPGLPLTMSVGSGRVTVDGARTEE